MNILQISPQIPFPPIDGGKRGIYNITRPLSERGHRIILVAFSPVSHERISGLSEFCDLRVIPHQSKESPWKILRSPFSRVPYTVSKYHSKAIEAAILEIAEQESVDLVHIDSVHCGYYGVSIKKRLGLPVVLRVHDYLTAMMQRFHRYERRLPIKLFSRLQIEKLKSYEGPLCEEFDRCLMVSSDDEKKLKSVAAAARTVVVPPSVDTSYFLPARGSALQDSILWFGSLDWEPNRDSLAWFLGEILPRVQEKSSTTTVRIVGSGRLPDAKSSYPPRVELVGFVDDIREAITQSEIAVVPLRIGSGVRLKLLELFAMGTPVVSTTLGAEGTGAVHGEHILLADTAPAFADAIIELLVNQPLRMHLSENSRRFAVERFDSHIIAQQIEQEYLHVIQEHQT